MQFLRFACFLLMLVGWIIGSICLMNQFVPPKDGYLYCMVLSVVTWLVMHYWRRPIRRFLRGKRAAGAGALGGVDGDDGVDDDEWGDGDFGDFGDFGGGD
jgi:uncharacterized membrane protein